MKFYFSLLSSPLLHTMINQQQKTASGENRRGKKSSFFIFSSFLSILSFEKRRRLYKMWSEVTLLNCCAPRSLVMSQLVVKLHLKLFSCVLSCVWISFFLADIVNFFTRRYFCSFFVYPTMKLNDLVYVSISSSPLSKRLWNSLDFSFSLIV